MTALPPPLGGLASDPSSLAGAIQSKVGNASAALASAMFSPDAGVAAAASVVADSKTNAGLATVDKFDYVVVGSGPGGATVARMLSDNPKLRVLLLEAGPDADAAQPISDSATAWLLPVEYVPQYFWQMAAEPFEADFSNSSSLPLSATRRRSQRRSLLHGGMSEQYMGGRLLGGSSSINGEQVVWPTRKMLAAWQLEAGGDPDWAPDACYARLRALETFTGSSPVPRGEAGPLCVSAEPVPADASAYGNYFVAAAAAALGADAPPTVADYNDPATPTSLFPQWQLSQNATTRARSSSSTAMLPLAVRSRPNLVVRTQATALRVLFNGATAVGVLYLDEGNTRTARASREVIVAAGHRSSLLLESSGVGNRNIIGPLLAADGRRVVADVPAVGENLRNDGAVLVPLDASAVQGVGLANPNDLYAGGAFLPYPNGTTRGAAPQPSTDRFSQLIGAPGVMDEVLGFPTFSIAAILLNVTSTGSAHILSGDPLAEPLVRLPTIGNDYDMANWYWTMAQQVVPIVRQLTSQFGFDPLTTEAAALLAAISQGSAGIPDVLDWVRDHYTPNHHWFGTNRMGTSPGGGADAAVVDSGGRVFGVRGLRVADASVVPVKPDGNTQIPAYLVGATIAEKILAGR